MEPRIQYAKTADGVSIAFWTLGEGMPLVVAWGWTHVQLEWQFPEIRAFYERLAAGTNLVRFDHRGIGLSDRNVTDYSLDTLLLDLEAVVDHLGLGKFAIVTGGFSGPVAITYAVRHSERVSHVLLWCAWARAPDVFRSGRVQAVGALRGKDWEVYTETTARLQTGWSAGEVAHRLAAFVRESVTPEGLQSLMDAVAQFDVTELLPQVRSPTLVAHRRQVLVPDVEVARGLASCIPGARLAFLEGESWLPFLGDTEAVLRAIDEFLGIEGEKGALTREPPAAGAFRTILFTDVEGSTALTQRLGDEKAREVLREHERIVREALKAHGGTEIKTMGDGFMASFGSATKALDCAIAVQRAISVGVGLAPPEGAASSAPTEAIRVRMGLNAGEPIAEEDDLFGTAVIMAARIAGQAQGGEILVSDVVRQLVAGKGFLFADRGETVLRGFEDPVRLYEVPWREEGGGS